MSTKPKDKAPMTLERAVEIIESFQKWRRGDSRTFAEMGFSLAEITEAIDVITTLAKQHLPKKEGA